MWSFLLLSTQCLGSPHSLEEGHCGSKPPSTMCLDALASRESWQPINKGAYGEVFRLDNDNVIKVFDSYDAYEKELEIFDAMDYDPEYRMIQDQETIETAVCNKVLRIKDRCCVPFATDDGDELIFVIMPYAGTSLGSLFTIPVFEKGAKAVEIVDEDVSMMNQCALISVLLQTLEGLACLGLSDLVHADVKPDNINVDVNTGNIMVIDLGVSSKSGVQDMRGSPFFIAPEVAQSGPLTQASDIYSLGMTAIAFTTGSSPLPDRCQRTVFTILGCQTGIIDPILSRRNPNYQDPTILDTSMMDHWNVKTLRLFNEYFSQGLCEQPELQSACFRLQSVILKMVARNIMQMARPHRNYIERLDTVDAARHSIVKALHFFRSLGICEDPKKELMYWAKYRQKKLDEMSALSAQYTAELEREKLDQIDAASLARKSSKENALVAESLNSMSIGSTGTVVRMGLSTIKPQTFVKKGSTITPQTFIKKGSTINPARTFIRKGDTISGSLGGNFGPERKLVVREVTPSSFAGTVEVVTNEEAKRQSLGKPKFKKAAPVMADAEYQRNIDRMIFRDGPLFAKGVPRRDRAVSAPVLRNERPKVLPVQRRAKSLTTEAGTQSLSFDPFLLKRSSSYVRPLFDDAADEKTSKKSSKVKPAAWHEDDDDWAVWPEPALPPPKKSSEWDKVRKLLREGKLKHPVPLQQRLTAVGREDVAEFHSMGAGQELRRSRSRSTVADEYSDLLTISDRSDSPPKKPYLFAIGRFIDAMKSGIKKIKRNLKRRWWK